MYRLLIKRTLDMLISIACLPILLIALIFVGLLILLDDKGPIIYKSYRIGKNGKIFRMYKFRSMSVNAPIIFNSDGSTYNASNDYRVTKIGKVLRETSLDELPQLLNVLKGDMSIVGPRASLASAISTFEYDEVDKMKVRPGITGYTQAYYRNGATSREKRLKDAWYANNLTLKLDLIIILRTFRIVVKREGIYTKSSITTEETNSKVKV